MFVGQYTHTLDEKNRLVLPSKFREFFRARESDQAFFVTLKTTSDASFLQMFPPTAWEDRTKWVEEAARQTEDAEWLLRKFAWDAEYCRADEQWRLILPPRLITAAGLAREVMIVGVVRWVEVWNAEAWRTADQRLRQQAPALEKSLYPGRKGAGPAHE